jgi:hypothetical protein
MHGMLLVLTLTLLGTVCTFDVMSDQCKVDAMCCQTELSIPFQKKAVTVNCKLHASVHRENTVLCLYKDLIA